MRRVLWTKVKMPASYDDDDVVDEVPGEGEEPDPRWDELKKIIDNN